MSDLISRQAAIDAIDVLKRNYPSSCFEDLCKAVDIAIKALSAQLEPSAVARDIATIIENEKDMRVIASAQPERKRGRWIPGREIAREYYGPILTIDYENYKCSSCGLTLKDLLYNVNGEPFYKYCPNCGAEMENELV